jgi:hypothetical protein
MKKYFLVVVAVLSLFAVVAPLGASAQGNNGAALQTVTTTVNVYAISVWNDTGVTLTPGTSMTITASGSVDRSGEGHFTDPDGLDGVEHAGLPAYSLIGQIGTGTPFFVGTGPTTVSGEGTLSLAFNDGLYTDNSGFFVATISYECMPGNGDGDKNHIHCGAPGQD